MEGGTLRFLLEPRARNVPTGTDLPLGVSFSFCGGSVRKETSVGCAQLNRSEGSDWRALWVLSHSARHKADIGVKRLCGACVCLI